jgi:molybdopterin converting factor small subunit
VKVRLRLFATLSQYLPPDADGDGVTLSLPGGATLGDVLVRFRIPAGEAYLTVVNGDNAEPARPLADGDEITLFPPLSGGCVP